MHAAVHILYRNGIAQPGRPAPLIGQMRTQDVKGVSAVYLWHLDWTECAENFAGKDKPLAVLWRPDIVRIGYNDMTLRGIERAGERWVYQKWLCDVLTDGPAARRMLERMPPFMASASHPK